MKVVEHPTDTIKVKIQYRTNGVNKSGSVTFCECTLEELVAYVDSTIHNIQTPSVLTVKPKAYTITVGERSGVTYYINISYEDLAKELRTRLTT